MRRSCRRPSRRCISTIWTPTATARRESRRAIRSPSTTATSSRSTSARARTRKTIARAISSSCGRRPGPCFWRIARIAQVDELARRMRSTDEPLVDFTALDGVRHAIWRVDADAGAGNSSRRSRPSRRCTSPTDIIAPRAPRERAKPCAIRTRRNFFLAVAFPSDQLRILPYNRVVRDLNGMTPEHFLGEVARTFAMKSGPPTPVREGRSVDVRGGHVVHRRSRERRRVRNDRHRHASTATCCRSGC